MGHCSVNLSFSLSSRTTGKILTALQLHVLSKNMPCLQKFWERRFTLSEAAKAEQSCAKSVCNAARFRTFHNNSQNLTQNLLEVGNFCRYIKEIWNLLHILHGLLCAGNKPKDISSFLLQVMYRKLTLHDSQRIFHFGAQDVGAKNRSQVLHAHFVYTWIRLDFIKESVGKKEVLKEHVKRKIRKETVKSYDCFLTQLKNCIPNANKTNNCS